MTRHRWCRGSSAGPAQPVPDGLPFFHRSRHLPQRELQEAPPPCARNPEIRIPERNGSLEGAASRWPAGPERARAGARPNTVYRRDSPLARPPVSVWQDSPTYRAIPKGKGSHEYRDLSHSDWVGTGKAGSLNGPTGTPIGPDSGKPLQQSVVPHFGQKKLVRRSASCPRWTNER